MLWYAVESAVPDIVKDPSAFKCQDPWPNDTLSCTRGLVFQFQGWLNELCSTTVTLFHTGGYILQYISKQNEKYRLNMSLVYIAQKT